MTREDHCGRCGARTNLSDQWTTCAAGRVRLCVPCDGELTIRTLGDLAEPTEETTERIQRWINKRPGTDGTEGTDYEH